jgi:hypothetical protein
MPGGDGTGPAGLGPRTGRGMGYCSGYPAPGYATPGFGRFGRGRGFRYWRRWPVAYPSYVPSAAPFPYVPPAAPAPEEELEYLQEAARNLEEELKSIKTRIEDLRSQK